MGLTKRTYTDNVTVITAQNLNDIQDAIIALEESPAQGLTEDLKQAMLQIARKVAYIDDQGQTYYDDLYDALYPPKTVVLITAVFEQGSTVIYDDTALDDLKQYLTVTAKYDDNTTAILADSSYTLSGLLEAGTSTVTVAYNGLTTTFTVDVTARPTLSSISAAYTQSGTVYTTDTLDSLKADLVVTAHYSDSSTQTVPAADYTLSGPLTVGTSTITVRYGGKTTTFSVEVTTALDSIAFGSLTYRDLFITNNEIVIGDFETTLSLSSAEVSLGNGRTYKINAGSPAQTAEESDSPTHSLKCFGSSSTQILYRNAEKVFADGNYLVCVSAKVTRYAAGYAGVQAAWPKDAPSKFGGNVGFQRTTNGFEHLASIFTLNDTTANRTGLRFYIGSFLSANLDCYVDDVICTPAPSDMTEAQGLALYEQYLHILREGL